MDSRLSKLYYSPKGYWKGKTAITKLSDAAGISEQKAKEWLSKQPVWQIYLPAPKKIVRPSFVNIYPNHTHQMDLLYLPHDRIRRKRFKYALTVVDIASRFKDAEPLTDKSAMAVTVALQTIYSRGPLKYPKIIQVDDGKEFKGAFNQLLLKHRIQVKRGIPGNHRSQALVENFNKQLSERLFSYQYHREIMSSSRNTEWVMRLPAVIRAMNNEPHNSLKPIDAINKKEIPIVSSSKKYKLLSLGLKVRYLYAPGEAEKDNKKRATDPIWSVDVHEINRIIEMNPPVYYLSPPAPQRSFVKEELQIIP